MCEKLYLYAFLFLSDYFTFRNKTLFYLNCINSVKSIFIQLLLRFIFVISFIMEKIIVN